jgi:hypothetical protein
MLRLTDSEMDIVFAVARPLAVQDRDPFLRDVAERLAALPHLGDGLVFQICREVQREHWEWITEKSTPGDCLGGATNATSIILLSANR